MEPCDESQLARRPVPDIEAWVGDAGGWGPPGLLHLLPQPPGGRGRHLQDAGRGRRRHPTGRRGRESPGPQVLHGDLKVEDRHERRRHVHRVRPGVVT